MQPFPRAHTTVITQTIFDLPAGEKARREAIAQHKSVSQVYNAWQKRHKIVPRVRLCLPSPMYRYSVKLFKDRIKFPMCSDDRLPASPCRTFIRIIICTPRKQETKRHVANDAQLLFRPLCLLSAFVFCWKLYFLKLVRVAIPEYFISVLHEYAHSEDFSEILLCRVS